MTCYQKGTVMKDSKSEKKVSIVIPIHNSADKLKKCLDSVVSQTETDFEVLMIDDGSTDSSGEIANSYTADPRFKYYFQENAGVSVARNRGLSMSSGKWIAFVDSDDSLVDEYLSTLLAAAEDTVDGTMPTQEEKDKLSKTPAQIILNKIAKLSEMSETDPFIHPPPVPRHTRCREYSVPAGCWWG